MRINTILFDMGGTLEDIHYSEKAGDSVGTRLGEILDIPFGSFYQAPPESFYALLQERYREYRIFREKTFIEVHPAMVWKDWVLRDMPIPDSAIYDNYEDLAYFWETEVIVRECRPGTGEMLKELKERGIRMGIISNTGSFTQVYRSLENYGIREFFDHVALSSAYGIRKPHGFIFRDMVNKMGTMASQTLYVGDTISRDVAGARNAGYFGSIQIRSEFTKLSDEKTADTVKPDYIIQDLMSIPEIVDRINQE